VVLTFTTSNDLIVEARFRSQSGAEATIEGTYDHPVWSQTRNTWTKFGELSIGEAVGIAGETSVRVLGVVSQRRPAAIATYNFTVADYHTYVIGTEIGSGDLSILVHNTNNIDCFQQLAGLRQEIAATGNVGQAIRSNATLMKQPPHRRFAIGGKSSSFTAYPDDSRIVSKIPADYVTGNKPWTGTVQVAYTQGGDTGITHFIKVNDGFADLTPFAETSYTQLAMKGDLWVNIGGSSATDIGRATSQFAGQMGVSVTDMTRILKEKGLTWHHHIDFRSSGGAEQVRMLLVPKSVNNVGHGGIEHIGGRAVIDFHLDNQIPLIGP